MERNPDFDIALSFAGEDREYVDRVANILKDRGVKVFYDLFEEVDMWGKNLYDHLHEVYQNRARFTVMFISRAYREKLWTNHERQAAQARAFQESQEYILPARFDDTLIPGVLPTIGYISLVSRTPDAFVHLITKKLISAGGSVPTELVRKDFSTASFAPAAPSTEFRVVVSDDERAPIEGATVVLQTDNGTTLGGTTASDGGCDITIQTRRMFRMMIAHPMFPAAFYERVDPAQSMQVTLPRMENIGSVIMHGTGYIPRLEGRLNPIRDTSGRTYLYAYNVAIEGGKPQPATFVLNEPFELEDAHGTVVFATVKHILARVSLVQFTRRPPS